MLTSSSTTLRDGFDRQISYLRVSITDRCDFRCQYCMTENMRFLPRSEVLSIEEILRLARLFTGLGITKIRVTGGEPLIRKGVDTLLQELGRLDGLKELAITTNGSQLKEKSAPLLRAGVSSINISLDSLRKERFRAITRVGELNKVLSGIDSAVALRFQRIRINAVILAGLNRDEVIELLEFAIRKEIDIAFIEEMPLGQVNLGGKPLSFVPSKELIEEISRYYVLRPVNNKENSGPSKDFHVLGTGTSVGFISPHTDNFCSTCNRLRITAEGRLLLCLGNEHSVDLRALMRQGLKDEELEEVIMASLSIKPERHVFDQPELPQIMRFMNATGG